MQRPVHPVRAHQRAATPTRAPRHLAEPPAPAAVASEAPEARSAQHVAVRVTRRHRRQYVAVAAAVALVASTLTGAFAWAGMLKAVNVDVDGHSQSVVTRAGDVAGVLDDLHVSISSDDVVSPAADAPLRDGTDVVVRRAHEVTFTLDGQPVTMQTTAASVGELLDELGTRKAATSTSSRSLLREQDDLTVATLKVVTLVVDGNVSDLKTNALTVAQVLDEAGVALAAGDRAQPAGEAPVADGDRIMVDHLVTSSVVQHTPVPFTSRSVEDPNVAQGTTTLAQEGVDGQRTTTYAVDTLAGVEVGRRVISDEVTTPAVERVVVVGTKKPTPAPLRASKKSSATAEAPVAAGSAREIGQQMAAVRGWTGQQWTCLDSLWQRESQWRVNADNPSSSAYGIPQALPGSKMASAGSDWRTNPATQITWGLDYIAGRYGTPCKAWDSSQAKGWY